MIRSVRIGCSFFISDIQKKRKSPKILNSFCNYSTSRITQQLQLPLPLQQQPLEQPLQQQLQVPQQPLDVS